MIVFLSGGTRVETLSPKFFDALPNRLISYHYMTDSLAEYYFIKERNRFQNIMIDSGAYTVWTKGIEIDIDKYADWLLKWQDKIDYIVNLDVIPGKPNMGKPTHEQVEAAAEKGLENYFYLLKRGVDKSKLVHVFHRRESFKWLETMLNEGVAVIGLSPATDVDVQEKMVWLDKCMKYTCDEKGYAKVKMHGFAITSFKLMERYPWFSVDSSSWSLMAGMGRVLIPRKTNGKWDYSKKPYDITFSQITKKKDHYQNQTEKFRQFIDEYLEYVGVKKGVSEYLLVSNDYELKENERKLNPGLIKNLHLDPAPEGKMWIERVVEDGVLNNSKWRSYLNALYYTNYAKSKKEPARYAGSKIGFNLV